jgi:hypothetical protein
MASVRSGIRHYNRPPQPPQASGVPHAHDGDETAERSGRSQGAIEGDRPTDEQIGNPHGNGVDDQGLPDDPIAIAEDVEGANEDGTQG